jgi:hypothetical protein
VNAVAPTFGAPAGSTSVTVEGQGFTGATAVKFGSTAATTFTVDSDTQITATAPAGSIGPVNVRVSDVRGASPATAANIFTYATAPDAPGDASATVGDGEATVSFSAPAANGEPITSYTVTSSPGGVRATGGSSPITVTGLSPWTQYTFTVTAKKVAGTGPASNPSAAVRTVARSQTTLTQSPPSARYGTDVKVGVSLASDPPQAPTPTGAVQFHVTNAPDPPPAYVNGQGKAVFSPPYYFDVGDEVGADYGGDSDHAGSTGALHLTLGPARTNLVAALSPNPATPGQTVTLTVTVRNLDMSIPPFGSLQLAIQDDVYSVPLDDNASAVITATAEAPGDVPIQIGYHDDTGFPADFTDSSTSLTGVVAPLTGIPAAPSATPLNVRQPPAVKCVVPRLKGKRLARAKRKLRAAHCALGKITKRKARRKQHGRVLATKPPAGAKRRAGDEGCRRRREVGRPRRTVCRPAPNDRGRTGRTTRSPRRRLRTTAGRGWRPALPRSRFGGIGAEERR